MQSQNGQLKERGENIYPEMDEEYCKLRKRVFSSNHLLNIVLPIGQLIVGMHSLKKLSTPDLILFSAIRSGIWI